MAFDFQGYRVAVAGGSRGIGRAIAEGLAREGAAVTIVGRSQANLDKATGELRAAGHRVLGLVAEATDQAQVDAAVARTNQEFGSVDILVNNAGETTLGPITAQDPQVWWHVVDVNLRGPYLFCRAALPHMLRTGWGRIINIGSANGKVGRTNSSAYCAAKHGLIGLTRALALEVADKGITVNAVCPGWVRTDFTEQSFQIRAKLQGITVAEMEKMALERIPQHVAMSPDDIVGSVLFFASKGAAHTTGDAMNVSAGLVMH